MAYINDSVFDQGLDLIDTNATALHLCNIEPTTYADASTTFPGGKSFGSGSVSVGAPVDGKIDGRRVIVPQTLVTGTANGASITAWALVDSANSMLLATGAVDPVVSISTGESLGTSEVSITIRDAQPEEVIETINISLVTSASLAMSAEASGGPAPI